MRCNGSCYGWLILRSFFSNDCHLFNPVTLDKIQLPPLPNDRFHIAVITYPPSDPKCVIMFFSDLQGLLIFCRVGDVKWIQQEVRAQNSDIPVIEYKSAISSNGKIYVCFLNGVAVIEVRDNFAAIEVYEAMFPMWAIPLRTIHSFYFLESSGEFFLVCRVHLGFTRILRWFSVFKLDLSMMVWKNVENLGNRVFLLGQHSDSVSLAPAEFGAKGNCIYFFSSKSPEVGIFDMDNGTITGIQLCPNKFSPRAGPFWMVPSCNALLKKEVTEITEEIQVTNSNLLPELLEMIFRMLHLDGIIRFRLSTKAFISSNPPVQPFHPQALSNSQHLPWLISFPYNKSNICHFYHPIYTDVYTTNLPQLTGAAVHHAKFGWLLMSVGRNPLFFFNPHTMETIKLPTELDSPGFVNISFSSPPTSSECVVFGLKFSADNYVFMSDYRKVQDCWSPHHLRNRPYTFVPSYCNPVFHNGMFYCLSKNGKLGIFDPKATTENDMWRVYTDLSVQDVRVSLSRLLLEDLTRSFIMECDGEIFSVFVGYEGSPVCVYKFDESEKKMKWLKVESLGNRLMFLSHTTSLLLPAVLKGTENRIYFSRFKGNSSVFYSLSSGNYHSFREQEEPQPKWIDTSEHWNCTWFQKD